MDCISHRKLWNIANRRRVFNYFNPSPFPLKHLKLIVDCYPVCSHFRCGECARDGPHAQLHMK